ncbi:cytochrome ubiquinol oxidase subunit I, partial [Actinomyces sp. MRS3W]|uniref:cytochrome ubiquinol oxidase subunit I n=1 Tax=Actinomyces sp. MRS3W TaxID=2800796 RepID=UPI0028FD3755
ITIGSGHIQGQVVAAEQPAKMAAAEMLCETESGAGFTVAAFGSCTDGTAVHLLTVPYVYSFMATNDPQAEIMGLNDAQQLYAERYGEGVDYTPNEMVTFWSFRLMIGLGMICIAIGAAALWLTRRNRLVSSPLLGKIALWSMWLPFVACSFGWILTEMGRQPWVVVPNLADPVSQVYMLTADGVSPTVTSGTVLTSMIVFTLLYAALGVTWFLLLRRYVQEGVRTQTADALDPDRPTGDVAAPLSFQY